MQKVLQALSSRTVWSAILMFLVAGVTGVQDLLPADLVTPVLGLLTLAVAYFRVNPQS